MAELTNEEKRLYAVWKTLARILRGFPFHRYGLRGQDSGEVENVFTPTPYSVSVGNVFGLCIDPNCKYRVTDIILFQAMEDPFTFAVDLLNYIREGNPRKEYDIVSATVMFTVNGADAFFCNRNLNDLFAVENVVGK